MNGDLEGILLIAGTLAVMGLLFVGYVLVWRVVFAYDVTDEHVTVLLFGRIPIYRIPFRKIVKMHEAPFHEVVLVPGKHFFTHMFGRRVVIETRDTWFPFTFLTPDNPAAFIAQVENRMRAHAR